MKKSILLIIPVVILSLIIRGADASGKRNEEMKIKITTGDTTITAVLNDTPASQDLWQKLPLSLEMHPHQNREFYADIRLSKDGKTQNNYAVGDIAYWTPGNSLVLFYERGYTGSLIIMGKIISGLNDLAQISGSFSALIEKTEG